MRRGYNDHFRFRAKNPFLGEGQLVFADGDDPGVQAPSKAPQPKSIHSEIQAGPQLKASPELIAMYPEGQPPTQLQIATDEFQVLEVNLDFLDRINRYIQTDTEKFDLGALPWKQNAEKISEAVTNLQATVTDLDLNVDKDVWVTIRNKEESEQRIQMVQLLSTWYEKIYETYRKRAQLIHELTVKAYVAEYDKLGAKWDDAPNVYRSYANHKKEQFEAAKANLLAQTSHEIPLGEEKRLVEMLAVYKHFFEDEEAKLNRALKEMEREVDLKGVQEKLDAVKERHSKEYKPKTSEFISKSNTILIHLRRLLTEVERSDLDDTEKKRRLKLLSEYVGKYEKGIKNVQSFSNETFSNSNPFLEIDENGKPGAPKLFKGTDGNMHQMPIGLQDRINMLNSGILDPEQVQALAGGIQDEVKNYDSILDKFKDDVEGGLDQALETISTETVAGPIREGFGSNREIIWMSPMDIWTMLEYAGQSFERSMNRTREYKVGKVGSMISRPLEKLSDWGPFKHFAVIPGDLDKKQTAAENEAVDFYMNDYKSNDDASVIQLSHEAGNKDQLKACIQLLAERGRLNWFDPLLLKQINRFQSVISFGLKNSDINTYHASKPKFDESLRVALDSIYGDADFFRNMTSQNESSFNSAKEKYKAELFNAARQRGGLQGVAVEMLRLQQLKGSDSKVDPAKFEYTIEIGITEGAIQPPELGLYMLIQAAHMGLLPFDRLEKLYANKAGAIPYLEIFNEKIFNHNVLKQWANIVPLDSESLNTMSGGAVPNKFMQWFHTFVMANPRVRGRIMKVLSQGTGNLDSDLLPLFIPYNSETVAANMLQINPHGHTIEEWVIHGASQYQLLALHNQLAHFDEQDKEQGANFGSVSAHDELSNMITNYIKWDSTLENRFDPSKGKDHVRWTDTMKKQGARCDFVDKIYWGSDDTDAEGNKYYGTTYGYALKVREIITELDPEVFEILFKEGAAPNPGEVQRVVEIAESRYGYDFGSAKPQDADTLYRQLSGIVNAIVRTQDSSTGTLRPLIAKVKAAHAEVNDDVGRLQMYPPISKEETGGEGVSSGWVTS